MAGSLDAFSAASTATLTPSMSPSQKASGERYYHWERKTGSGWLNSKINVLLLVKLTHFHTFWVNLSNQCALIFRQAEISESASIQLSLFLSVQIIIIYYMLLTIKICIHIKHWSNMLIRIKIYLFIKL